MRRGDKRIYADHMAQGLRTALRDGDAGLKDVPMLVKKIIAEDLWRERIIEQTGELAAFEQFEEFVVTPPLEGLGANMKLIENLVRDDIEATAVLEQVLQRKHGGDHKSEDFKGNNITLEKEDRGTARQYALRRLRKASPDLHAQVVAGEVSPNAAMIEAGFRQKTITIKLDPVAAAKTLKRHMTPEQIKTLRENL